VARRVQRAIPARLDAAGDRRVELTQDVHRRAEQVLLTVPANPCARPTPFTMALAASASMAAFARALGAAARGIGLATYLG
jgi:hypothetical protein